ncbi:MAG: hypothetical protein P8127_17480, partial [Acidobacteriota bacterium]
NAADIVFALEERRDSSPANQRVRRLWLEELARDMLADGQIRLEWENALENPDFAANPRARYMWWYQRTPYWDETVGLLPVLRVMNPVDLELETWPQP